MQAAKDAQRSPDAKETQSMEQAIGRLFGIAYFRSLAALLALAAYHFFRWPTTWYQWRRLRWQWRWCSQ